MKNILRFVVLAGAVAAAHAQLVYSSGHADIGIGFEDGALEPHWHFHGGAVIGGTQIPGEEEYEPGDIMARVTPEVSRPPGSQWDFLGVASGQSLWYLPQNQEDGVPFLGFGAEELNEADWVGPFSITLVGKSGAGEFSLWQNDPFGGPVVRMATFDGISSADTLSISAGGHAHYNWGFTQPGVYAITLQFQGMHATLGELSQTSTFSFNVVPEPATGGLVAMTAGLFALRRRRASA